MNATQARLRIGFIPLADAAALIVAVDKGFAAASASGMNPIRNRASLAFIATTPRP